MEELINRAKEIVNQYPALKEEIEDTLSLAACEIEAGESEDNEIDHAHSHFDDLIKEHKEKA